MATILLLISSSILFVSAINVPPTLSEVNINKFLGEYKKDLMDSFYFQKQDIEQGQHGLQKVWDTNIMFCPQKDLCAVGIGSSVRQYQRFKSYINSGHIKYKQRTQSNVQIESSNSFSYNVEVTFIVSIPSFEAYLNTEYTVSRKKKVTFDAESRKIIEIEVMNTANNDQPSSTFDDFQNAFIRLFSGLKTKAQAQAEVAILNDISDLMHFNEKQSPSDTLFGVINKDVVIVLSGLSSIIIILTFTVYICCKLRNFAVRRKNTYAAVKQIDC